MVDQKPGPKPVKQRVAETRERKREKGLCRVEVWVPENDAQKVHDFAKGLRDERIQGN